MSELVVQSKVQTKTLIRRGLDNTDSSTSDKTNSVIKNEKTGDLHVKRNAGKYYPESKVG